MGGAIVIFSGVLMSLASISAMIAVGGQRAFDSFRNDDLMNYFMMI